jgi:hypothetical protein
VFYVLRPGQVEVWAVPLARADFGDAMPHAQLRARMREAGIVAYSWVTQVWASAAEGEVPPPPGAPGWSDREEYVMALATDGINTRAAYWKIRRDYKGATAALELDPDHTLVAGPTANLLGGLA